MARYTFRAAFTLVELSVVLVIIGLLVAGVLAAKDMIRAAEVRSVISEQQKFRVAFNTFHDKYGYLPGDLPNAQDFWGVGVTNGDGDRFITGYSEAYYAWRHLSQSGLIPGDYLGAANANGDGVTDPGIDAPVSKYSGGVWVPFSFSYQDHGLSVLGNANYHNLYVARNMTGTWNTSLFLCDDAFSIDKKIDDGKPFTGKVTSLWGGCKTGASNLDEDWTPSSSSSTLLRFRLEH